MSNKIHVGIKRKDGSFAKSKVKCPEPVSCSYSEELIYINYVGTGICEDLILLGPSKRVVKDRDNSILYDLGRCVNGMSIEVFLPKRFIYVFEGNFYIPLWLAKNKGIGWYFKITDKMREENKIRNYIPTLR